MRFIYSCLLVLSLSMSASAAAAAKVAVWDPAMPTKQSRFRIDLAFHDHVAEVLKSAGMEVSRVTAEQIADTDAFSAGKFDALIMGGDAFPRKDSAGLKKYLDEGGVLVALDAMSPFMVAIEPDKKGDNWTMSPEDPKFAWQSSDIYGHLGITYDFNPGMHDLGFNHSATPLLKKYLPEAVDLPGRRLPSRWFPTVKTGDTQGRYYPLIRSRRLDAMDTTPQVYVVKNGKRSAVVCGNRLFTTGTDSKAWPMSDQMIVAMARIASDLHNGSLVLGEDMAIDLPKDMPRPLPLTSRVVTGNGVDPEGAKPVVRWGRFDGSALDLPAASDGSGLARSLAPGASIKLAIPAATKEARYLRIRGAYTATGAGLKASVNSEVVIHELFNYFDASGAGNTEAADLKDVPAEFNRIVAIPTTEGAAVLTLSNPGNKPVYFDAVQVEIRPAPAPAMMIGFNAAYAPEQKINPIPTELSKSWGQLRVTSRGNFVGAPDDPKRWDRVDGIVTNALKMNDHVQLLLEGTPKWAVISPEALQDGINRKRPHVVAPDPAKYAEIVEHMVSKFGDRIDAYEIWNEANGRQFFNGTYDDYVKLFHTIVPIIKKLDPGAKIMSSGMAGWSQEFFEKLIAGDCMKDVDWLSIHVYAGKSSGWDLPYGQTEGAMFAAGFNKPINCNEQGFVHQNSEWFTAPPNYTPVLQASMTSEAMARLLSSGVTMVSIFHAGGNNHPFSYIDAQGKPRPGYAVVADYMALNGGVRCDAIVLMADDSPLRGIYHAASVRVDGTISVVINPSEVAALKPPTLYTNPTEELNQPLLGYSVFDGKTTQTDGRAVLAPSVGKTYMGFGKGIGVDTQKWPLVEVVVPECEKFFQMTIKAEGQTVTIVKDQGAGTYRADLRKLFPTLTKAVDGEFTIRAFGRTVVDAIRFLPDPAQPPVVDRPWHAEPVPVLLRFPMARAGRYTGEARVGEVVKPVDVQVKSAGGHDWAEVTLGITGRTVLTLKP